jgi:hypothetical protein
LQPGDEKLVDLFLGEQFADFGGDFGERNFGGAGLLQLGDELIAIISLDGLGIDLDSRAEAGIDEAHQVDLLPDVSEKIFFSEVVKSEKRLPGVFGRGLRILFAGIGDVAGDLVVRSVAKVGGIHLLMKKFLVNESVENGAAVIVRELGQGTVGEESFVTEGFVPIALKDDAAVNGGNDSVDHFCRGALGDQDECPHQKRQRNRGDRSLGSNSHQNG